MFFLKITGAAYERDNKNVAIYTHTSFFLFIYLVEIRI